MKSAINTARADIAKLTPARALTDEGRLFASLAELARKALPAERATAELAPGIVKALQLVDELDATLNGPAKSEHYFKQDQALFEPAPPAAKPVLVASTPEPILAISAKPEVDILAQGAKLVIIKAGHKTDVPAVIAKTTAEVIVEKPEPIAIESAAEIKVPVTALPMEQAGNPRIVIIRRKPDEMSVVPLADEAKAETAA